MLELHEAERDCGDDLQDYNDQQICLVLRAAYVSKQTMLLARVPNFQLLIQVIQ